MFPEGTQVLLTFVGRGNQVAKAIFDKYGVEHHLSNAASKDEILKMKAFNGAVNPDTGKFEKVLNVDWYIKNHKPFPKKYYWSKVPYVDRAVQSFTRKTRWDYDQILGMLETPVGVSPKVWEKLTEEEKLQKHAEACLQPGEHSVYVNIVY